ncbi:MAG: hypothetical protein Q8911_00355 [Bacillota bacterium]|nr:hypothetical protein [Bacillota bacterium]
MAWHDEYPHSVFASVLLLDGKIENWKIGGHPKKHAGDWSNFWKLDRINDYTVEHTEFIVNNQKEHNESFERLAPEWFKKWQIASEFIGSKPYREDVKRLIKDEILVMEPGRELDALVAEKVMEWELWNNQWSDKEKNLIAPSDLWSPSTDISAAWEVVKKLTELGKTVEINAFASGRVVVRVIGKFQKDVFNSAPEAICKAALLAVGVI